MTLGLRKTSSPTTFKLFVVLLLFTFNVNASKECEKTELNRLKEVAKKVEFDYDYKLNI